MEKNQAKKLIEEVFRQKFDKVDYEYFLKNILNNYESRDGHYTGNYIPESYRPHIKQYWRIGKYIDPESNELDLLVVEVKSLAKLERARTTLRNFAINRLKQFEKQSSLIAFYAEDDKGADWRFSFIKIEHEAYQDDKGKIKLKQELTPAKRYSYLVGIHEHSHTASQQLLPLLEMDYTNPHINKIENAFSIEKVTDEFFDQYKTLFQNLTEHLKQQKYFKHTKQEQTDRHVSRFSKKLLGQIVFLYFLQKKGWLGVPKTGRWGEGSRSFMRERYDQVTKKEKGNYYHNFLQFLFYEALANERKRQKDPGYYKRFDCRIPFLNGGLFEADYDWQDEQIELPNTIFHNTERTKAGDHGTGILDVFNRFNFTIKEDEPFEKEVAVDPEMLGKVFENMLNVTERKSKGAYYTPREIVHYMCQESLIHYLDNNLNTYMTAEIRSDIFSNSNSQLSLGSEKINVPKTDIETLIRKGHLFVENDEVALRALDRIKKGEQKTTKHKIELPESVKRNAKAIDNALADIKVCDPAIGSGAFPVGLLHEIVNTRLALAPHSGNKQSAYELKRHVIAENHYGVDVDPSAIDIARLRLWLSLIVDEEDFDKIEALPNLDYKIIQGDSLIGFRENWNSPSFKKIEDMKKQFFEETDHKNKVKLKEKIDKEIQLRLDRSKKTFGWQVKFDFRLMFSEVWHQKAGFDVIIGNPPYVQIQKFSGQQIQKDWENQNYETFAKTGDIYCLFYEKGRQLLRDEGVLAYISSNKWMRADYGEKLRRFFSERTQPLILIDFSSFQVFDATVDTNVLLFRKEKRMRHVNACLIDKSFTRATPLQKFIEKKSIKLDVLSSDSWVITDKAGYIVKQQIEKIGTPLNDWDITINRGIVTGLNDAFIIDSKKKDELTIKDKRNTEIIKPFLNGPDLKRYKINFADTWLLFIPWHFPLHNDLSVKGASKEAEKLFKYEYPALYSYFSDWKNQLSNRNKSETGKRYEWYALQRCAASYYKEFSRQKIVWGNLALSAQYSIAEPGFFVNAPSNLITGDGLKYILVILNSEPADYYIRSLGVTRSGGYFEYKPMFVEKLPVPIINKSDRKPFEILADYILVATSKGQKLQSAYFEQIIDGLVYELYFSDEIKTANKDIFSLIGKLTPISDKMKEGEKLSIIQRVFNRLYDPHHPVRNNLETLDSVDAVRTIRDALDRK